MSCHMPISSSATQRQRKLCLKSLKTRTMLSYAAAVAIVLAGVQQARGANEAPFIDEFYCINDVGDYWTLTGCVTDGDDPVEDDVVTFGGVLEGYSLTAPVDVDGVFCITVYLPGLQGGIATAQTTDPRGADSNEAWDWISE